MLIEQTFHCAKLLYNNSREWEAAECWYLITEQAVGEGKHSKNGLCPIVSVQFATLVSCDLRTYAQVDHYKRVTTAL